MNNDERDMLIMKWRRASASLIEYKAQEMFLRKQIAAYVLDDKKDNVEEISVKLNLGNGYGLKAKQTLNYKLEKADKVVEVIDKLNAIGETELAGELFKWEPKLSETTYKHLENGEAKKIVDEILTIGIGAPKVEFIEPKVKA